MTRFTYVWETVSLAPLPHGWLNVYSNDDGTVHTTPCPAVLVEECRAVLKSDEVVGGGRSIRENYEPPYETRAVFADFEFASLIPADDASNYLGTVGPGQDPQALAKTPGGAS